MRHFGVSPVGVLFFHSRRWSVLWWPWHLRKIFWKVTVSPNLNDAVCGGDGRCYSFGPLEVRHYTTNPVEESDESLSSADAEESED